MNIEVIKDALMHCVETYRKQADAVRQHTVAGILGVTEINTDPHESLCPADLARVDVHFFIVGVDREKAIQWRPAVIEALLDDADMLKRGPSFLTIAMSLGDQGMALALMGLGEVMGLWRVITPAFLAMPEDQQDRAAGCGYVMTSGFRTGPFEEGKHYGIG